MAIKVEGLDKIIKDLDQMKHGLTTQGINEYCEEISRETKRISGLHTQGESIVKE
jgi:hypothetical protein